LPGPARPKNRGPLTCWPVNRNNHPHPAGAGQIIHNGVIRNHRELVRRYGLHQVGQCDSEALGLLMARGGGTILQRAKRVAREADGGLVILGVWRRPARLLVVRRGRPLHWGQAREGFYFATMPYALPRHGMPADVRRWAVPRRARDAGWVTPVAESRGNTRQAT